MNNFPPGSFQSANWFFLSFFLSCSLRMWMIMVLHVFLCDVLPLAILSRVYILFVFMIFHSLSISSNLSDRLLTWSGLILYFSLPCSSLVFSQESTAFPIKVLLLSKNKKNYKILRKVLLTRLMRFSFSESLFAIHADLNELRFNLVATTKVSHDWLFEVNGSSKSFR